MHGSCGCLMDMSGPAKASASRVQVKERERECVCGVSQLTQNHGTVLQIAPAIMGPPKGEESGPNSFAASCLTVS